MFSRKEHLGVFECMCNPPGGDWSGISYFLHADEEYRWTSLPRVSAIGGKRPDHIIQVRGQNSDVFFSIESKLKGRDLETNIGTNLKTYIKEVFQNLPTAHRTANKDWRLFEGQELPMRSYTIISVGAYAFENVDEMKRQIARGNLDVILAFEFGEVTMLHVLHNAKGKAIVGVLKQVQLGFDRLKVQIH